MHNDPYISVVVCIYNGEKILMETIDSLLKQKYPNDKYEIILIDDGSSDKSAKICRNILDKQDSMHPIITYAFQKNGGLSAARNTGIYLARGQIIAFIDQDAIADTKWLTEIQKPFSDKQVGVVGGRIEILNAESAIARFIHIIRYHQAFGPKHYENHIIGTNMAYRKAIFEQIGGFSEEFIYRGDETSLLSRLLKHYQFAVAPSAIVYHEQPNSIPVWLNTEFKEGRLSPLAEKFSSTRSNNVKKWLYQLEQLIIANSPIWIIMLLYSNKLFLIGLSGLILSCLFMMRRHFFRPSGRRIFRRLVDEYQLLALLIIPIYLVLFWLRLTIRTIGWLRGQWTYLNVTLALPNKPNGNRTEQIYRNI